MATPRFRIHVLYIQWRRRIVRKRMLRELGWRSGWELASG
jgi:hypothetical protein